MKTIERLRELLGGTTSRPWSTEPIAGNTREGVPCFVVEREINGTRHAVICGCGGCEVTRRDVVLAASAVNALPALLAVVEAQAAEIRAWRDLWDAMKKDHNGPHTQKLLKKLAAEEKTDAALRALEGGA